MHIVNTIAQFHRLLSLPDPLHPLVSVVHVEDIRPVKDMLWERFATDFYTVSLKRNVQAKAKYGLSIYDFDKGVMSFTAPKQLQSHVMPEDDLSPSELGTGFVLMIHPEFLMHHPLAQKIRSHGFFDYTVNEALHLSEREQAYILDLFGRIEQESQHIDKHTREIILSQIELLLNYSNRFYERQFITRQPINNNLLSNLEQLLNNYFDQNKAIDNGLPAVTFLADQLHVSQRYLSDMLRTLTGQTTQQHIHEKLIEKAKEKLSTTTLSVSEIAYQLGFEQTQSFSRLFKSKTKQSPVEFREQFNELDV